MFGLNLSFREQLYDLLGLELNSMKAQGLIKLKYSTLCFHLFRYPIDMGVLVNPISYEAATKTPLSYFIEVFVYKM